MTGTAVVKQTLSQMVVEGAGLDAAVWQPARVAALQKLLPPKFQASTENLIALASLVDRTGLDPFIKELYCWDDKGRVTYHVGRDGWLKIAKRDPDIISVASGVIFEQDEFGYVRDDNGAIHISHSGGFPQGPLLGAWALVRQTEGPDQLVTRELAYYKHLLRKDNWSNYPAEMLETRVIATAIKFVSQLAAGLYAPGEASDDEYVPAGIEATQERAGTLKDRIQDAEPVEVVVEAAEVVIEPPAVDEPPVPPSDPVETYFCKFCGQGFSTHQGRSSHLRTHKLERDAVKMWAGAGYNIAHSESGNVWTGSLDQTGEIVAEAEHFEDLTAELERHYSEKPDPVDVAANPVPEPDATTATVTQVYKVMTELGDECDAAWLKAHLALEHPADEGGGMTLFDLTGEDRAGIVSRMREAFGG